MNFRKSQCFHVVLFSSNVYCEAFQKDSGKYAYIFVSTEKNTTVTFYLSTSNLMCKKHKDLWTKFLFHRKSSVHEMHHRRKKTKMKKNKQLQRNHTLKIAASNFRRLFALYEGKWRMATSFTSPSWCLRFSYINWTKLFFLSLYVSLVLTERLMLRIKNHCW